ncbi:hypothetical protein FEM48_Zijuj11G0000900 [Ziziphus jujuba var. spinosa]|uniref:TF-B3 domain-containing protein n=1 Tax=Ziziphus jujuba var. spinosa TaxID=714518 RepID=A0A978UFP5_ZIZJJ|nr:hypothetical protein FEM48_Zijuj11G0000900 [Ziziphus jujuba var. spinosa]
MTSSSMHDMYDMSAGTGFSSNWVFEGQEGPDTKLELMESSPGNEMVEDGRRGEKSSSADAREGGGVSCCIEREHMFDKVVTPSDVGKLNRLVIPKQHAEKYFPLDSSNNEKGLLLNFEDRNGKPWRFRYSYWNSSQSYVMTKGWSRFVKEKKLDAGDIVSFQRGLGDLGKDRLYIDWRRRPDAAAAADPSSIHHRHLPNPRLSFHHYRGSSMPWSPLLMRPPGATPPSVSSVMPQLHQRDHLHLPPHLHLNYGHQYPYRNSTTYGFGNVVNPPVYNYNYYQLRSASMASASASAATQDDDDDEDHHHHQMQQQAVQLQQPHHMPPVVFNSVPVVHGKAAAKRLRLFGVNMECPTLETTPSTGDEHEQCGVVLSPTTLAAATPQQALVSSTPSSMSQSAAAAPHHQLRLYHGTPLPGMPTIDFFNKGKASMSFDFDI